MTDVRLKDQVAPKVLRATFACALGAALLMTSAPVRAGDDDKDLPIDRKIMRGILEGLGLKRDGEAINYQERPPLVIPPARDLPPPEKGDGAVAGNPAWPKDPDVSRRKTQAAVERSRNINAEQEREQNPLRPDQMTPGSPPKTKRATTDDGYKSSPYGYSNPSTPSELGYKGNLFSNMFGKKDEEEVGKFTGEPPRASLTDPPPGYRTPSPGQPYGAGKAPPPKPTDYAKTHGEIEGDH